MDKVLMRDPNKRLTLQGIQAHPFYTKGLPKNFFAVNEQLKKAGLPPGLQVRCRRGWHARHMTARWDVGSHTQNTTSQCADGDF